MSSGGVCYTNDFKNGTSCLFAGGNWQKNDKLCLFGHNETYCKSFSNFVWESCSGFDYNTCDLCADQNQNCPIKAQSALSCFWNSDSLCDKSLPPGVCETKGFLFFNAFIF